MVRDDEIPDELRDQVKPLIVKSRDIAEPKIEWFKLAGDRVIDREEWLGKYIPIVPFIGEETVIAGEMDRKGHTRSQIDAQRIYNYWASAAVEQVALQTKSPYVARADAIEGREEQWATANVKNWSVLVYNSLDEQGNPIQRPEREPPPQMAQAYIQGMQIARQDLMSVTGQYQAELGMPSNERSGIAIQQRQRQGDTATYHYIDNQAKGIRQIGRILHRPHSQDLRCAPGRHDAGRGWHREQGAGRSAGAGRAPVRLLSSLTARTRQSRQAMRRSSRKTRNSLIRR